MRYAIVGGAIALAISTTPAFAKASKHHASTQQVTDQQFVVDAASANMAEAELGKIAEAKTSDNEVKNFAKLMVADHEKALNELKTVAKDQNITLPTALDAKDQALKNRLDKLSGDAFDHVYMSAMVRDHRHDVTEFRAKSENATIAEVKQYASNTLPTLRDHLKLAQEIDHSVVGTPRKRATKTS